MAVATVERRDPGRGRLVLRPTGDEDADLPAVTRVVEHAFGADGLRQLTWTARVGDEASRRLAWLCGFSFEGTVRGGWVVGDGAQRELHPAWVGTLLVEDSLAPKTRWLDVPALVGDRVRLREVALADGPRSVATSFDPESLLWLGTLPFSRTLEEFADRYAVRSVGPSLGSDVSWTIADAQDDRYLGTVSLFDLPGLDYSTAEVGYRCHPDERGRGVVTEAVRLVIRHAFAPADAGGLGLLRLRLGAGDGNGASLGVARACGFVETGRDRSCYDRPDGSVVDLIRFDLLASDLAGEG